MGTSGDGSDKRIQPRIPFILKVDYPNKKACADATENLSAGGFFIQTEQRFELGQVVPLSLSFPGLLDPIEMVGKVAWVRPGDGGVPAGVGVLVERQADKTRLQQLVSDKATATTPVAKGPPAIRKTYRVLIVDDSPHILEMYSYALRKLAANDFKEKAGLEVLFARDGHEALSTMRSQKCDLVMTDLNMPVMDGFELIEHMRRDEALAALPVMAISALDRSHAEPRALALGVNLFLQKPLRLVQILETVKKLLHVD